MKQPIIENLFPTPVYMSELDRKLNKKNYYLLIK